jgi:hypothetical protein
MGTGRNDCARGFGLNPCRQRSIVESIVTRPGRPTSTPLARLLGATGLAATLGLVALHLWLFAERLAQGTLAEPGVALRWIAAVFLGLALVWLRCAGVPLLRGRHALVFWLAVLALHAGAAVPGTADGPAEASAWLFVLPATTAPLAVGLAAVWAHILRRHAAPRLATAGWAFAPQLPDGPAGLRKGLAPRGPPA